MRDLRGKGAGADRAAHPGPAHPLRCPWPISPRCWLWCLPVCPVGTRWALGVRDISTRQREPVPIAGPCRPPCVPIVAPRCCHAPTVCDMGTARATFSHLPVRVTARVSAPRRTRPGAGEASMCNAGLWAGPRGRGERRGWPGGYKRPSMPTDTPADRGSRCRREPSQVGMSEAAQRIVPSFCRSLVNHVAWWFLAAPAHICLHGCMPVSNRR